MSPERQLEVYRRKKDPGHLRLVFLSRISYKKNLTAALKIMSVLPANLKVDFDIYGPIEEPEYWKECELLIQQLPAHIRARYVGAVANNQVSEVLRAYHVSILLTLNENFGHSIVESLASGCPVLLSDQTPWKNLQQLKAGWDYALNNEKGILQALQEAAEMNQESFNTWSDGALQLADRIINNPESIQQHQQLFN
jgi:glycosyltransferase involved in cell wall biosynthesis